MMRVHCDRSDLRSGVGGMREICKAGTVRRRHRAMRMLHDTNSLQRDEDKRTQEDIYRMRTYEARMLQWESGTVRNSYNAVQTRYEIRKY